MLNTLRAARGLKPVPGHAWPRASLSAVRLTLAAQTHQTRRHADPPQCRYHSLQEATWGQRAQPLATERHDTILSPQCHGQLDFQTDPHQTKATCKQLHHQSTLPPSRHWTNPQQRKEHTKHNTDAPPDQAYPQKPSCQSERPEAI